jgi:hypothetical protein
VKNENLLTHQDRFLNNFLGELVALITTSRTQISFDISDEDRNVNLKSREEFNTLVNA